MSITINIENPAFLSDMLQTTDGLIKAKNLLSDVFMVFFQSRDFCERDELSRSEFTMMFEEMQTWLDAYYRGQVEQTTGNLKLKS